MFAVFALRIVHEKTVSARASWCQLIVLFKTRLAREKLRNLEVEEFPFRVTCGVPCLPFLHAPFTFSFWVDILSEPYGV